MSLPDGEDWLMRPVVKGCLRAESLLDCTVDLEMIARINDALDVEQENEHRLREALKAK